MATPTLTPLPVFDLETVFPLAWPVKSFSHAQINEAKACAAADIISERYPNLAAVRGEDLLAIYEPRTGCDWAVLAMAYIQRPVLRELMTATPDRGGIVMGDSLRLPERPPAGAIYAFGQAVAANPAFAFVSSYSSPPLYAYYMNGLSLVEPPPVARQPVTAVDIQFEQIIHVPSAHYDLHIRNANTAPVVSGQITRWTYHEGSSAEKTEEMAGVLRAADVQSLGGEALSDLLPVDTPFRLGPGIGYAINWQVTLTFADNSTLLLTNNGTLLFAGAPWFVEIDGQAYMQYSTDFLDALLTVTGALNLPPGNDPSMTREMHWSDGGQPLEIGFNAKRQGE
jgi:hypothetical protein